MFSIISSEIEIMAASLLLFAILLLLTLTIARKWLKKFFSLLIKVKPLRLFVKYQPIVDLYSSKWCGAEALVRLNLFGIEINPSAILFLAQKAHLSKCLTRVICRKIAKDHYRTLRVCNEMYISINLTLEDLMDDSFPEFINELFEMHGISQENIVFEITEQYKIPYEIVLPQILKLKKMRFRIALDDFGTGYSGLQALERLPIDILKLDKCFFSHSYTKYSNVQIHVMKMASSLSVMFVAEGIETKREHTEITLNCIQYAQGWFYSQPLAADEFARSYLVSH